MVRRHWGLLVFAAECSSGMAGRYVGREILTCGECSPMVRTESPFLPPCAQAWGPLACSPVEHLWCGEHSHGGLSPGGSGTAQQAAPTVEVEHGRDWGAMGTALGPHGAHVRPENSGSCPPCGRTEKEFPGACVHILH